MSSLANTNWTIQWGPSNGGGTSQLSFGPIDEGSGGACTVDDAQAFWVERGIGSFMIQIYEAEPTTGTLTTYMGTHTKGAGTGWSSPFFNGTTFGFTMKKNS